MLGAHPLTIYISPQVLVLTLTLFTGAPSTWCSHSHYLQESVISHYFQELPILGAHPFTIFKSPQYLVLTLLLFT